MERAESVVNTCNIRWMRLIFKYTPHRRVWRNECCDKNKKLLFETKFVSGQEIKMKNTKNMKKECLKRMQYLKGHLEGVCKMLESDRYCIDVIRQNLGVIAALHKVNEKLLMNHFEHCVTNVIKSNNLVAKKKIFKEILEIYKNKKY
jgi:CsoR family transcriptional regulator, copper-sensing transcriptional repressor